MDINVEYTDGGQVQVLGANRFTLPLWLTVPVWLRHQLSIDDIAKVLGAFPVRLLVCCLLLYGIDPPVRCIMPGSHNRDALNFSKRALITRTILAHVHTDVRFQEKSSVLCTTRTDHTPLLPLHTVTKSQFKALTTLPSPITWRGIHVVPRSYDSADGYCYCVRVVRQDDYARGCLEIPILAPLQLNINGQLWYLLEEALLFKE